MDNFDKHGRNIGEAIPINVDAIAHIPNVANSTPQEKRDAVSQAHAILRGNAPAAPDIPIQEGIEPESESLDVVHEEPQHSKDAQQVSKRSLRVDDLDADELIVNIDGEEVALSKEDLKKGAGLYEANNKKSRELAQDKKALEAEKAVLAVKISQEVEQTSNEINRLSGKQDQINDVLAYAYERGYDTVKFKDGTSAQVAHLEKEHRANTIRIERLNKARASKQAEAQRAAENYVAQQRETMRNIDPTLENRLTDIESYVKSLGFNDAEARHLLNVDARFILALDKARKYDGALSSKGEKREPSQTRTINRTTGRSENAAYNAPISSEWQKVFAAGPKHPQYRESLKNIRMAQMKAAKN